MKIAALLVLLVLSSLTYSQSFVVKVGRYTLKSNPWVNLHARLLYEARFKAKPPAELKGDDLVKWTAAVDAYRKYFGNRSPIFDNELINLDLGLSSTEAAKLPASIPQILTNVLTGVMPVYRSALWTGDDYVNRFCISTLQPMLASAADELIAAHEKAYGMPFPKQILVDVTARAWEFGAYTVGPADSAHVVFQCADNPANQGYMALESLLHEPSHVIVDATSGAIGSDLAKLSKELGIKPRHNLWHAILFYTSGELTRRALVKRGVLNYTRMIDTGMYERGFQGFKEPLEKYWQGYLDGKSTREAAIKEILLATSQP